MTTEFELKGEFIALCDLLKTTGIAQSGGQGKAMVADGHVRVDGEIELRKTAKIRKGQMVECFEETIKVN
jgi:ribosome-associated protein